MFQTDLIIAVLGIVMFSSLFVALVCTIFENSESVAQLRILSAHAAFHSIADHNRAVIRTAKVFLDSLYGNDGIIPNFWRLFSIGLLLNFSLFLYLASPDSFLLSDGDKDHLRANEASMINAFLVTSVIATEFLTVVVTRFLVRHAARQGNFTFIIADLAFLSLIFYFLPVVIYSRLEPIASLDDCSLLTQQLSPTTCGGFHPAELSLFIGSPWLPVLIGTPVLSFLIFSNELSLLLSESVTTFSVFSLFLPAFSLCLPSLIVVLSGASLYFSSVARMFAWTFAGVSKKRLRTIRSGALGVFGIAGGFASYIGLVLAV